MSDFDANRQVMDFGRELSVLEEKLMKAELDRISNDLKPAVDMIFEVVSRYVGDGKATGTKLHKTASANAMETVSEFFRRLAFVKSFYMGGAGLAAILQDPIDCLPPEFIRAVLEVATKNFLDAIAAIQDDVEGLKVRDRVL